jgi:hypothetical protein
MTAENTETNFARLMVQVFAEYLRKWEARQEALEDDSCRGVGVAVRDRIDVPLCVGEKDQDLHSRNDLLVQKNLNEARQDSVAGDSHSKG